MIPEYAEDAVNTPTKTVLLMKIGGGGAAAGIHGAHVGENIHIRYAASDVARQTIPWVEYTDASGKATVYAVSGTKPPEPANIREMDCIDCHNRPSHPFQPADRALNAAMAAGNIPPLLPFIKKQALEIVQRSYSSKEDAAQKIPAAIESFYRANYAGLYLQRRDQVRKAAQGVLAVYNNNVFPDMRIAWGTYPDNIGHMDSPGCFRCHDGNHAAAGGQTVTQDCSACHNVVAVQEPNPKILTELGIGSSETSVPDPQ